MCLATDRGVGDLPLYEQVEIIPINNLTQLCNHTRTCTAYVRMTDADLSLASTSFDCSKELTAILKSGAGMDSSTFHPQNSEKSLSVDSVQPEQARKHLGYWEPHGDKIGSYIIAKSFFFAPQLQFEYHFYTWTSEYNELEQPDFWQLLRAVKKIRETPQVKGSTNKIVAACDRFFEIYKKPEDMPSKEEYLASLPDAIPL